MKIMFAGGGTAGHVNPAIAIAGYIQSREASTVWLSGGRGNIEERLAQKAGIEIFTFKLGGFQRSLSPRALGRNLAAAGQAAVAAARCRRILRRTEPDVVVGTGGYASFPMVYAAAGLGIKTAILEVNAAPGMATRRLAGKVDCVMTAFEETAARLPGARRAVWTGVPVRQEIWTARHRALEPLFKNGLPTVVCFWGSVGALHMNDKMVDFIAMAARRRDFNLLYAAGQSHIGRVRERLAEQGFDPASDTVDLRAYIDDMDRALARSDLVICRAGGTLMELCAAGRPAIIVPSPWVAEQHQEKNARVLEKAGAAMVVAETEATAQGLYDRALALLGDRETLVRMGRNAEKMAQPQALETIYGTLAELVRGGGPTG